MAEPGNLATVFSAGLVYDQFRRSIMLGLTNRGYERDFASAFSVTIPVVSNDNIQVDTPADGVALETSPTYTTATLGNITGSRALIRATSQRNLMQAIESRGGAELATNLMERMNARIATKLDDQIATAVTGATYGSKAGNGFSLTRIGVPNATNGWGMDAAFPNRFKQKGSVSDKKPEDLFNGIYDAISDAELKWRNLDVMGGQFIGDGQPTGFAAVGAPAVARQLVIWARDNGVLDLEASAGRQAASVSGILGNMSYEGRIANCDIIGSNAFKVPGTATATTVTNMYFLPINGSVAGAVRPMLWDFAEYGQGNTDGKFISRSTSICPYMAQVYEQPNMGRVSIAVV